MATVCLAKSNTSMRAFDILISQWETVARLRPTSAFDVLFFFSLFLYTTPLFFSTIFLVFRSINQHLTK